MSFYILRFIAVLGLSLATACSTSNFSLFHTEPLSPGPVYEWQTKLAPGSGRIEIRFQLESHSSVDITFGGIKKEDYRYAAEINLNDRNCTTGHNAKINYKNQKNEYYTSYYDKPAPWNAFSTLIIAWDENKNFSFELNKESITVSSDSKFTHFSITSYRHPINIQSIFYTKHNTGN